MKKILFFLLFSAALQAQTDTTAVAFKKRVLESTEIDFVNSYYKQDGEHSAVSGGIGTENLTDLASNIVVSMPLNDDDVLTVDVGISAYSSASSSNINPFNSSGASGGGGDDDRRDDDDDDDGEFTGPHGTPWQASSGASKSDQLFSINVGYNHSSDSRNTIWNADLSFSNEFDYTSFGFGGGITRLINHKNTEFSLKLNAYLDQWRPIYPTELHEFSEYGADFQNQGYFNGVEIYDQAGNISTAYLPNDFAEVTDVKRNSYSASFGFSQIATKKMQFSIFFDLLQQQGLLSTPYQRIYFSDRPNYYIGQPEYIAVYNSPSNRGVYRLADDIERLPDSRFKFPVGARMNYYLSERFVLRTYYRFYSDDWGISSHTAGVEFPVKLTGKFTAFPIYRFYTQEASKYFAPFESHLSTEKFYTSDYDLAGFDANQYGFGVSYSDVLVGAHLWKLGLKNVDFRYNHYRRSDGLNSNIASLGIKFVVQ